MRASAVIMAGGKGERFWPMSRTDRPKQFLPLCDRERSMIRQTTDRVLPLMSASDVYIATNARYRALCAEHLPDVPAQNVLCEPVGRNTAPCIGLAAAVLRKRVGDCVMVVLSSDHQILDEQNFRSVLQTAIDVASQGENIVTMGIAPAYAETGYGYIHFDRDKQIKEGVHAVNKFVEKPSLPVAEQYVASGEYLWNSGMFVFKVSTIMAQFERYMPTLYAGLQRIEQAVDTPDYEQVLAKEFEAFESVSIDYGVMEHASNIYTLIGTFGWDDVGGWTAVGRNAQKDEQGNALVGDVLALQTKNCTVYGGKRLIATMGLEDLIIVDTEDVLMITRAEDAQQVKTFIQKLNEAGKEHLL